MHHLSLLSLASLLTLSSLAAQQDILHYKFDENGGTNVVNFAPAGGPAPREGAVMTTDTTAFAPGRFGLGALRGVGPGGAAIRSYIDSGWNGTFSGDYTVAWWMLQRTAPTGTAYIFDLGNAPATQSSFRMFTGGVAARGLYLRYWGGTPNPLVLSYDVQTASAANWLHVALVVDSTAATATWYINGQVNTTTPIVGPANVVGATQNFLVGFYPQFSGPTYHDLDEFRFLNRAALPHEILIWSMRAPAADGGFGNGCGLVLAAQGGRPAIGNGSYSLTTTGPVGIGVIAVGTSRLQLGGIPLPFDLGNVVGGLRGCLLHTSASILLLPATNGATPLPLPNDASLEGATVYAQALLLGTAWTSSNALAISLGY